MHCTSIPGTHYLMLLLSVQRFMWIQSIRCGQSKFFNVDTGDVISTVLYDISVGQVFANFLPRRNPLPMKMFLSQTKREYICQLTL